MHRTSLLILVAAATFATCAAPPATTAHATPSRGAQLYAHHCAVCHGAEGDADTVVAQMLLPRPATFRSGLFKLVSTANGMPTEDDLVQTLRRGMPGSTMMSWGWMPEEDLRLLAQQVRTLAVRGRAEAIHQTAAIANRQLTIEQATAVAERELQPGPMVETGVPAEITAGNLAEGERLYLRHCASCHGADGRGLPGAQDWPTDGTWLWPRDFTSGYLRGEATHRDLALRIRAGMPGAHMPPTMLSTAETEALAGYVKGLIPQEASAHHAQWRRTVRLTKLPALPADDDDAAFERMEAVRLPLAPLWWRPTACNEVWLRAGHDGKDFVVRLEWSDATRNDRARPGAAMGDGVAIQFARATDPPLFAMGSREQPVNVWRWHAFDPKETAGMIDLVTQPPHGGLDVPIGVAPPEPRSESVAFTGIESAPRQTGGGLPLHAVTRWSEGKWTTTFRRSMRARNDSEVDLAAGGPVLFALAVWNGAIDEHAGSKSITTWHVLEP